MKVCDKCEIEIFTVDGTNRCDACENATKKQRQAAAARRKAHDDALRSVGLVKVRGALGGTYWE